MNFFRKVVEFVFLHLVPAMHNPFAQKCVEITYVRLHLTDIFVKQLKKSNVDIQNKKLISDNHLCESKSITHSL